jgi:hypothetical protein
MRRAVPKSSTGVSANALAVRVAKHRSTLPRGEPPPTVQIRIRGTQLRQCWRAADGLPAEPLYAPTMSVPTPSMMPMPQPADRVTAAAQESWRGLGETSQVVAWSLIASALGIEPGEVIKTAIMLPQLMRIECVLDDQADMRRAAEQIRALLLRGWTVNALLPLPALGSAHQALRGLSIQLQGWWTSDDDRLHFTSPETP